MAPAGQRFKPGDRVVIARGPGAGLSGTVCAPGPGDRADDTNVWVQFDREPGTRYCAPVAGLDHETTPKKPPMPSVVKRRDSCKRA